MPIRNDLSAFYSRFGVFLPQNGRMACHAAILFLEK
jgi:hypothetical protein